MKKYWLIAAILLLSIAFGSSVQAEDKEMYVDVSVATLWSEPDQARDLDAPSLSNPVDMWEWTESMTYEEKKWLVGELQTQALYGQKVTILEEQGDWVKVAVDGQPTPKNELGYPAWMPKDQLADQKRYSVLKEKKSFALVTAPTANIYDDRIKSQEFKEISFNTRLPVVAQTGSMVLVATPSDGMKWVSSDHVSIYKNEEDIPNPDGEDVIETGKQFLGLPYLWAGASGFGFDCSGFTHTIYKAHGITIPRDSSVQAEHGTAVSKDNLQKGDLLFFAYEEGEGSVHHVGMYIGDGQMIHAPNSESTVEIIDVFESDYYSSEFAGARRYID
ncbi:Cell wall-associated hydrolase, NlpC family [Halobacillus dabanensis]|uniref:Cell wall-associated hydrolase, NlpC family n=1 Tax=Halobacillus dabanensis TaxID=240302 RepID=A0A1I3S9C1_HALDA|nr:C40 family peptidase [Halobacillus dabanensis]SFJ54209.1 Cell wall-associated hydrolase, NlpC family [Halobacillus dabanensis]